MAVDARALVEEFDAALIKRGRNQYIGAVNRVRILREEALELVAACDEMLASVNPFLEQDAAVFKELCDVIYTGEGLALEANADLGYMFELVHANNLLKVKNGVFDEATQKLLKPVGHPTETLICDGCGGLAHRGQCKTCPCGGECGCE